MTDIRTHGKMVPTHLHPPFNTLFATDAQLDDYLTRAIDNLTVEQIEPLANLFMQLGSVPGTDYADPQYAGEQRRQLLEPLYETFLAKVGQVRPGINIDPLTDPVHPSIVFFSGWFPEDDE